MEATINFHKTHSNATIPAKGTSNEQTDSKWTWKDYMLWYGGASLISVFAYCAKRYYDSKEQKETDDNKSANKIKEHHEASQDTMNEDDNHTDNKIKLYQATSEIRITERKTMIELEKERYMKPVSQAMANASLRTWIDNFHSYHKMPDTSRFSILHDILKGCPDGYEDAMLLHGLSMFGTMCFSRVRSKYLDGKVHAPNIMVVIEGKRGSGKDKFTTVYNTLFKRIIDSDRKKLKLASDGLIIQTGGISVSYSQFFEILDHNRHVHVYAYESEISAVKDAFGKKGSLTPSILRKAFDNDVIYQNNKNAKSVKGSYNVFFNYTFTGTPEAVDSFFTHKEEEGGTARRQCFTVIPELELFAPTLDLPGEYEMEKMKDKIDEWRGKYCFTSLNDDMDIPCPEHNIDLNYVCDALEDWSGDQGVESLKSGNDNRNGLRLGIASIAFHCAMVLHMLAGEPQPNDRAKRKAVKDMAVYIANYCMERYLTKFCNETLAPATPKEGDVVVEQPQKHKLTQEEIEEWYYKRGMPNDDGQIIGLGTIAKTLGVNKDDVKNAFKKYEKQMNKGCN